MKELMALFGESVIVASDNIILSNEEDELGGMLFVNEAKDYYEITMDCGENINFNKASKTKQKMAVDFSVSKPILLELTKRDETSIFKLAVLFEKFGKEDWFDTEKLSKKLLLFSDNNYEIKKVYQRMCNQKPTKVERFLDESYSLIESFEAIS